MSRDIRSELGFLNRDELYEAIKPYSLRFTPQDGSPRHNLMVEMRDVAIYDARSLHPSMEKNGFALTSFPTKMAYKDFDDEDKISAIYALELKEHLQTLFRARHVKVIDYAVRRRHPDFPVSTGTEYADQQPARLVHLDFSHDEGIRMLRTLYGARAEEVLGHRWQIIKGPLFDWPLAVCDAQTFDATRDSQVSDAVYPEWAYENVLVHSHPDQRWYYFYALEESETMLFKCTDSDVQACGQVVVHAYHSYRLDNMLTPLFTSATEHTKTSPGLEIVVIPALGLGQPSQWISPSGSSWLSQLFDDLEPDITILEYTTEKVQWSSLSEHIQEDGKEFLQALQNHRPNSKSKLPVVFICHGTGGLILKRALCLCERFFLNTGYLIQAVSGLIFLGSPHFQGSEANAKTTIELLLKYRNKGTGRLFPTSNDAKTVIETCQGFERLNLNIPVVSVYESEATVRTQNKLFRKFLGKGQGDIIVPKSISRSGVSGEKLVDGQSNHLEICNVDTKSPAYRAILDLLSEVIITAPQRMAKANMPYVVPRALQTATLASEAGTLTIDERLAEQISIPMSQPTGNATGGSTVGSFEFVPSDMVLEEKEKVPILPCFMFSSQRQLEHFLGREDVLATIDRHLLPKPNDTLDDEYEGSLRSFAICGLGGMGKTSVAAEYAFSRNDFFDAIFWLNADSANILAANFAQIAALLGLEDDSSDLAASRSIAMNWLSKPLKRPSEPETRENVADWLIIFDNVDNLDILSEFWPGLGQGSVLVTSRDPQAMFNMHIRHGMNLASLSLEDTERLLQRLTNVPAMYSQKEAVTTLAKNLGGLPLAINQTAGVFRQFRISYTSFLKLYDEEGIAKVFENQIGQGDGQESRSLATIWALDRLAAPTRALLQVICLLDPDEIPEELLINLSADPDLPEYPQSEWGYVNARGELLSSSLINLLDEKRKISLHRLIQDTVLRSMDNEQLTAAYRAAIKLFIAVWPFQSMKDHHSVARFGKCEIFFPSVLRLKNGLESLIKRKLFFPRDLKVARLFNDVGWYMFERGLPEETEPFCNVALLIGEQMKTSLESEAHETIRESHSFLGIALVETNKHSSSMYHKQQWLDMLLERRSASGTPIEDYELGYAYNEIGVAYGNNGMPKRACEAFFRSIFIFQGLDDYDDTMLGWPEPNLGFMYWLLGDYAHAEEAFVEILDIHATEWGVDDTKSFKTGKILYGLGNVMESQGRFEESLGFHLRCLEQYRKVLGHNHHRFGDICHKMASHFMRKQQYQEANIYVDMALKVFKLRSYLSNELARTTYLKGRLYREMGQNSAANGLMREAYDIRKHLEPMDSRPLEELDVADFDQLVAFWSR
ncbi:hypothetical protein PT974_03688 [Cladobotryum mycophilum]|uniref:DUF7779 domain-containing protein n=1 Tax=Cladobotryum mycophilum TaxID=491253 RepID=A0ABR0ST10_9HYPO